MCDRRGSPHRALNPNSMKEKRNVKIKLFCAAGVLAAMFLASAFAVAGEDGRNVLVVTSTNAPSGNDLVVFRLDTDGTPTLSLVDMLPTGGNGGASGNAGAVQFKGNLGAVANFGSNSVSQLVRYDDFIGIG